MHMSKQASRGIKFISAVLLGWGLFVAPYQAPDPDAFAKLGIPVDPASIPSVTAAHVAASAAAHGVAALSPTAVLITAMGVGLLCRMATRRIADGRLIAAFGFAGFAALLLIGNPLAVIGLGSLTVSIPALAHFQPVFGWQLPPPPGLSMTGIVFGYGATLVAAGYLALALLPIPLLAKAAPAAIAAARERLTGAKERLSAASSTFAGALRTVAEISAKAAENKNQSRPL